MKQKDIALIIVIAGLSTIIAVVIASLTIGSAKNRETKVQTVEQITADFKEIDKRYINDTESINPTQTVRIGGNNNPDPFN